VTAADQTIADDVARHLGLFASAAGSDGRLNLKGPNKLAYLREKFPDGYIYAGDGSADLPVFRGARGVILCDVAGSTAAKVAEAGVPVLATLRRISNPAQAWRRAFRVTNGRRISCCSCRCSSDMRSAIPGAIVSSSLGFALLCLLSSATYIVNDLADLDADRAHATKRLRPFASGGLKIVHGLIAAPLMIAAALAGAVALSPPFAGALLAYLVLTTAYSFGLKRVALLDVFVIGILFTLRIVMGVEVVGLTHSAWLLSFALAFFISLALSKRHGEVMRAASADAGEIAGRGYRGNDWAGHAELRHRHRPRVDRHHAALHDERRGAIRLLSPAGPALRDPRAVDALADAHLAVEQSHAAARRSGRVRAARPGQPVARTRGRGLVLSGALKPDTPPVRPDRELARRHRGAFGDLLFPRWPFDVRDKPRAAELCDRRASDHQEKGAGNAACKARARRRPDRQQQAEAHCTEQKIARATFPPR
jgi:hypothetical protein